MALTLRRYDDLDGFTARAMPFLLEREPEHNLFIGICSQIADGRYTDPYLVSVERDDRVVAAAFRTPPFQLGLSHIADEDAIGLIAEDARAAFDALPGVLGSKRHARLFAEAWRDLSSRSFSVGMEQRIYQATEARNPFHVPGEMRPADGDHRGTLVEWFEAFHDEVGGIMGDAAENVDRRLADGRNSGLDMWWDGRIVSIAGWGAPTPNGIRVGPVYTPPDARGRGYASACVATLTQRLLDDGRRFVFLYTDLANPISNSIYQRIGYRPVCDVDQYRFSS